MFKPVQRFSEFFIFGPLQRCTESKWFQVAAPVVSAGAIYYAIVDQAIIEAKHKARDAAYAEYWDTCLKMCPIADHNETAGGYFPGLSTWAMAALGAVALGTTVAIVIKSKLLRG
jgi:hypothetical protein